MPAYPSSPFGIDPRRSGGRVSYVRPNEYTGQASVSQYDYRQPMQVFNGSAPIGANAATAAPMFGGHQPQQQMGYQPFAPQMQPQQQPPNPSYSPPGGHSQNFLQSVQRNNFNRYSGEAARAQNYGDPTYAAQLGAKVANFAPPQGPTVVMGGGRSGQPFVVPPGANVVTPGGATGAKPINPVDRSTAFKNYLGKKDPVSGEYSGFKPDEALRGAEEDMGLRPRPGDPTSQPTSQPFLPPQDARAAENQRFANAGGQQQGQIQLTEQHARAMWTGLLNINPPGTPFEQLHGQFKTMLAGYGVSGETADRLAGGWMDKGTDRQTNFAPPAQPAAQQAQRMPLSMLGASNGMDPSQNSGAARQATPGPSIGFPVQQQQPQQQVAVAPPGYSPLPQQQTATAQGAQPTTQPQASAGGGLHYSKSTNSYWRQTNGQWQQVAGPQG